MRRLALLLSLVLAGPALAQTYPFEGRWRDGGNACEFGLILTSSRMSYGSMNGGCRLTRLTAQGEGGYAYAAQCDDDSGRYATSGTMRMVGRNRLLLQDRLMRGQVTAYDRC